MRMETTVLPNKPVVVSVAEEGGGDTEDVKDPEMDTQETLSTGREMSSPRSMPMEVKVEGVSTTSLKTFTG